MDNKTAALLDLWMDKGGCCQYQDCKLTDIMRCLDISFENENCEGIRRYLKENGVVSPRECLEFYYAIDRKKIYNNVVFRLI